MATIKEIFEEIAAMCETFTSEGYTDRFSFGFDPETGQLEVEEYGDDTEIVEVHKLTITAKAGA